MLLMEMRLGRPIEDHLRSRYVDERATVQEIADDLGVNVATVSRWMAQLGIEARYLGRPRRKAVA